MKSETARYQTRTIRDNRAGHEMKEGVAYGEKPTLNVSNEAMNE